MAIAEAPSGPGADAQLGDWLAPPETGFCDTPARCALEGEPSSMVSTHRMPSSSSWWDATRVALVVEAGRPPGQRPARSWRLPALLCLAATATPRNARLRESHGPSSSFRVRPGLSKHALVP